MNRKTLICHAVSLAALAMCFASPAIAQAPDMQRTALLGKLRESTMAAKPKGSPLRTYRLMIAPTWGNLICFRIQNTSAGGVLIVKRLERKGYENGPLIETKEVSLSNEELQSFEQLVAASRHEKMGLDDPDAGLDGDNWTLEVSKAGFYHEASRWCPNGYDPKKRRTEGYVTVFRWAADKAGVTQKITNKGHPIFDR